MLGFARAMVVGCSVPDRAGAARAVSIFDKRRDWGKLPIPPLAVMPRALVTPPRSFAALVQAACRPPPGPHPDRAPGPAKTGLTALSLQSEGISSQ